MDEEGGLSNLAYIVVKFTVFIAYVKPLDDEDPTYFRTVGECIHLNPVEAGLVTAKKPGHKLTDKLCR